MNYYSDSAEWKYLFNNAIPWDKIVPLYYSNYPTEEGFKNQEEVINFLEEMLTQTGEWTGNSIANRAREIDEKGGADLIDNKVVPKNALKATYKEAAEIGIFGLSADRQYGGLATPFTIGMLVFGQIARACMSTSGQLGFFSGIADMIDRYCDQETKNKFIPQIIQGKISGSMCLTEPGAGSDVGSLRTTADKQEDGTYLLNGTKCFITNGGGGLAFILARTKNAPAGLEGISMFFAEEWLEDSKTGEKKHNYRVSKLEEKLGLHGSPTCEVVYENTIAHLVGKENDGFKLMLHLMNEARISVGLQSLGGIEACLHFVRQYAETRKQFGKCLLDLPLYRRNLQDWEIELDAFRALMVDTVAQYDIFQKLEMKKHLHGELTNSENKQYQEAFKTTRRRTPLVKYYGAETYTLISQRAIQALGGYGFMKDYDVERFHRDSFAPLLYEGTSQIQALMAMKDFVKATMKDPAKFIQTILYTHPFANFVSEVDEYTKHYLQAKYEFRKHFATLLIKCFRPEIDLSDAIGQFTKIFTPQYWNEPKKFDKLMTHAETLCQALAYLETLRVLAKHASKDKERASLFYNYDRLVNPRLVGIYADWKNFSGAVV